MPCTSVATEHSITCRKNDTALALLMTGPRELQLAAAFELTTSGGHDCFRQYYRSGRKGQSCSVTSADCLMFHLACSNSTTQKTRSGVGVPDVLTPLLKLAFEHEFHPNNIKKTRLDFIHDECCLLGC
jgi:hypothetical protein